MNYRHQNSIMLRAEQLLSVMSLFKSLDNGDLSNEEIMAFMPKWDNNWRNMLVNCGCLVKVGNTRYAKYHLSEEFLNHEEPQINEFDCTVDSWTNNVCARMDRVVSEIVKIETRPIDYRQRYEELKEAMAICVAERDQLRADVNKLEAKVAAYKEDATKYRQIVKLLNS